MDTKKIAEQVIEALRGDIEREVEKRVSAQDPKFEFGEYVVDKFMGHVMIVQGGGMVGYQVKCLHCVNATNICLRPERLCTATDEEVKDALKLQPGDVVRMWRKDSSSRWRPGCLATVTKQVQSTRPGTIDLVDDSGIEQFISCSNIHLVRRAETSISDEPDDLGFTEFERAAVKHTCSFPMIFGAKKRAEIHKSTRSVYHPCDNNLHALHLIFKNKSVEQLTAAIEACLKDPDRFMRGVKVDMTA